MGAPMGFRVNWPPTVRLEPDMRDFARCSASARLKPAVEPALPWDAQGDDELERRLGALESVPALLALEVVVVRGILEARVALGMRRVLDALAGFACRAAFAALGALSTLGAAVGLGPGCFTDLRAVGLKAGLPDAGRVRLLGSGLLVESVTCNRLSHRAICDC